MKQSRLESLLEACLNVASGFMLSLLFWVFVIAPWYGLDVTMAENLEITAAFTVLSIARSYTWRRFFNAGVHRGVHRLVRRWRGGGYAP